MGGPYAAAGVAVEVFVKRNVLAKVWIRLQLGGLAQHGTISVGVFEKYARQPVRELRSHLFNGQIAAGARRALDAEVVAVIMMKLLQRFDDEEIERKPDGAAPIRIAAELPGVGFGRRIAHRQVGAVGFEYIGLLQMRPRKGH